MLEMHGYNTEASDDAIESYIDRHPEYDPLKDPNLEGVNLTIVSSAKLRVDCWNGSSASCLTIYGIAGASSYAMFGMGPDAPIGNTPGENTHFKKDVIGDPDCPGCGYVGLSRNVSNTSQLDVNMLDRLQYQGTISSGGRSGGNRPLYGLPNSYVKTTGGHTLVYDGSGRLIYDINANRVKMTIWNRSPDGVWHNQDVKLKGPVPPGLLP